MPLSDEEEKEVEEEVNEFIRNIFRKILLPPEDDKKPDRKEVRRPPT